MPTIKQWEDSLHQISEDKLEDIENALHTLSNWALFEGTYPEMKTYRAIANHIAVEKAKAELSGEDLEIINNEIDKRSAIIDLKLKESLFCLEEIKAYAIQMGWLAENGEISDDAPGWVSLMVHLKTCSEPIE